MFRIAFKGLLGKKKDTFLLWSVVALAFVFLVLSTTLITSLNETDENQRISTYGSWQAMQAGILSAEKADEFSALGEKSAVLPMVKVKGADYFAGDNEYYFSTYSENLEELGQFKLKEGRWPEKDDEVVLEYARLSALGLEVGDSFTVASTLVLPFDEEIKKEQAEKRNEYAEMARQGIIDRNLERFRNGTWELYVTMEYSRWDALLEHRFFAEYALGEGKHYIEAFADEENPNGRYIPFEEMTEEEFLKVLNYYLDYYGSYGLDISPYMTEEDRENWSFYISDLIGYGDMNIRASQQKSIYSDFDPFYDMANTTDLTVTIPKTYTVCGVIETYSDRWDSGKLSLPGGFITEESYDIFVNAQKAVLEKYPNFGFVEYENIVLISSDDRNGLYSSLNEYFDENESLFNAFFNISYYFDESGRENVFVCREFGFNLLGEKRIIPVKAVFIPEGTDDPKAYYDEALERYYTFRYSVPANFFTLENENKWVKIENDGNPVNVEIPALSKGSVYFEYGEEEYLMPFEQFQNGDFEVSGMKMTSENHIFIGEEREQADFDTIRLNTFAYPSSSEGSGRMLVLVTVILFVTTVCAVFQIFFTQVRKRMRRVILMKSIGAENGQIAKMYFWEFFFFWISTLPVGIIFGLGGAYITAAALENIQGREIIYSVDPAVFVLSLCAGSLALILGMIIPVIMAVGVPLTGRTVRKKPLAPPKKEVQQNFLNVTLRGLTANRAKTIGNAALCVFMMLIMTLCIFIGFRFMNPYREAVQRNGKPEYLLQSSFAMSERQLEEYLGMIDELGVADSVTVYRHSDEAIIPMENAPESILLKTAFPEDKLTVFTNSGVKGYPVSVYSFGSNSPLFEKISEAVTIGSITAKEFDSGEKAILLVPLYNQTEPKDNSEGLFGWENLSELGIETSFYSEFRNIYDRDSAAEVGKTFKVAAETRSPRENYYEYEYAERDFEIGAVVFYFPEEGIWPLGNTDDGWKIICSEKAMTQILPNAYRTRTSEELRALEIMNMATGYGTTDFYITLKEGVSTEDADTALLIFSRANYMDIEFYHESSRKLLNDGVNNILLTCILGLTAVLIALLIFSNTISSDIEQERNKIGILQSLGVSNNMLIKRQFFIGLAVSGFAVVLANILLWGGVMLIAFLSPSMVLGNLLWGYPWMLHIGACIVLAAIITMLYVMPMRGIRHYLPIENIKTRK